MPVLPIDERGAAQGCGNSASSAGGGMTKPALIVVEQDYLPIVSTLTGSVAAEDLRDPEYFVRQVRQPVRFADAFTTLRGLGVTTFLELGPDAVLTRMVTEATEGSGDVAAVPMLRADQPEDATAVAALATLFRRRVDVDLSAAVAGARVIDLPEAS
jgi:acyl transferase domain-containing protein